MKTTLKIAAVSVLALVMLICALPVSAAHYTWEDDVIPAGWDRITREEDITATDILTTVNPNASQEAKNLLAYLGSLTDSRQFIYGQFDIYNNDQTYQKIKAEYGVEPGLYSARYIVNTPENPFAGDTNEFVPGFFDFTDVDAVNALLKSHYDNGNILLVHSDGYRNVIGTIAMHNKPDEYISSNADAILEVDRCNPERDMQCYAAWMLYQHNLIEALKKLEASGVKAYMWRPWVEFNGGVGFGGTSEPGYAAFTRVWQQTIDMMIDAGLTGFLATYSPASMEFVPARVITKTINRWPGNDYVDVCSVTMYSDTIGTLPADHFGNYDWYLSTGKPIGFSELGVRTADWQGVGSQPRSSCFDLLQCIMEYWPGISWCNFWDSDCETPLNGDGGSYGNDDGLLFVDSPYTLTLDEIPDYRQGVIPFTGVVQLYPEEKGKGGRIPLEQREYTAKDLAQAGIDLTKIRSMRINTNFCVTFYSGEDCTGDYWGYGFTTNAIPAEVAKKFRSCKVGKLTNIALDVGEIYASVNDENAYKVNDGRPSLWQADTADPDNEAPAGQAWVMIDLGKPTTVGRYILKNAFYSGSFNASYNLRDFRLEYSSDGKNWKTLDTVTGNTGTQVDRIVDAVAAQYFRLYITEPNSIDDGFDEDFVGLSEFELYGLDAGALAGPALPEKDGLYKIDGVWVYVKGGAIAADFTGFAKHYESGTWFYVTNGKLDWNISGAFKHPSGVWFIVKNGQIDWGFNGFYKAGGVWFYFKNGQIVWETTGLYKHPSGTWFYVKNAQIDWGYTGFAKHNESNTWFYVENGSIAWSKSGAFKHPSGIWFMVNGGQIDWSYTGLYKANGAWFYFRNGQLDWGYTGRAKYGGQWFNVKNGQVVF